MAESFDVVVIGGGIVGAGIAGIGLAVLMQQMIPAA